MPAGDADRNDTQNDAAGLASLGLAPEHVHRVAGPDASESAEASAAMYEAALRDHGGGDARLARQGQAFGIRAVADDGGHPRVQPLGPALLLRGAHDGGHVAAGAGDQDDDVFHLGRDYPCRHD